MIRIQIADNITPITVAEGAECMWPFRLLPGKWSVHGGWLAVTSIFGEYDSLHVRMSADEGDEYVWGGGGGGGVFWIIWPSTDMVLSVSVERVSSFWMFSLPVKDNSLLHGLGVSSSSSETSDLAIRGGGGGAGAFLRLPANRAFSFYYYRCDFWVWFFSCEIENLYCDVQEGD